MDKKDYFSPPASGSFRHDGMVIVPCSMGTAARIAHGISDDLVTRAADVCLKERRKLILVPRETPWNLIHLRNMTLLAEAGATIVPAAPGFYHKPKSIDDLVDFMVGRILQQLGIEQTLIRNGNMKKSIEFNGIVSVSTCVLADTQAKSSELGTFLVSGLKRDGV